MQAKRYLHGSVSLSTEHKGKRREHPVWLLRYRLPSGEDSRKTLGKAWLKTSRPPATFMTKAQAETAARHFLDEHATSLPDDRRTPRRALTTSSRAASASASSALRRSPSTGGPQSGFARVRGEPIELGRSAARHVHRGRPDRAARRDRRRRSGREHGQPCSPSDPRRVRHAPELAGAALVVDVGEGRKRGAVAVLRPDAADPAQTPRALGTRRCRLHARRRGRPAAQRAPRAQGPKRRFHQQPAAGSKTATRARVDTRATRAVVSARSR
jgi:hypothetical protein